MNVSGTIISPRTVVCLVLFIGLRCCCAGEPGIVGMGAMEKLALFSPEAMKNWPGEE